MNNEGYKNILFSRIKNKIYIFNFKKIFILLIFFITIKTFLNNFNFKKKEIEQFNAIIKYISMILKSTLFKENKVFYKLKKPKISIVIGIYNGEGYIKNALLSIQNQNFKDIEIIIVDDCSEDNSINLIKKIMKKDKRIVLYKNIENRGTLYTKTRGVLNSKGKYVMILDQDDMYIQNNVFSTLYNCSEKNNLDILGFSSIFIKTNYSNYINIDFKKQTIFHYFETPILYQPNVSKRMFDFNENGIPFRNNYVIWDYIFKEINKKIMNIKMNCHEDFLLFFSLTRKAYNLKYIPKIFIMNVKWDKNINNKIKFSIEKMEINKGNLTCLSYINYLEFLLLNTNNSILDKRIASTELNIWYLNNSCKYNIFIREKAIKLCKLFLNNKYIEKEEKKIIKNHLNIIK